MSKIIETTDAVYDVDSIAMIQVADSWDTPEGVCCIEIILKGQGGVPTEFFSNPAQRSVAFRDMALAMNATAVAHHTVVESLSTEELIEIRKVHRLEQDSKK